MSVREAVIVGAVRTPVGRRGGALSRWHPVRVDRRGAPRLPWGVEHEPGATLLLAEEIIGTARENVAITEPSLGAVLASWLTAA